MSVIGDALRRATSRLRCRLVDRDDGGYALILVIGTMLALSLIVAAGLEYSTHALAGSRHEQDFGTSLAAVQAGAEDFQHHLNVCDDYWQLSSSTCFSSFPTNASGYTGAQALLKAGETAPSAAEWANAPHIPGTNNTSPGTYLYQVLGGPFTPGNNGSVRLQVWGRSKGVTRTAVVNLSKRGFSRYIYFTDIEATDPATVLDQYKAFSYGTTTSPCYQNGTTVYTTCSYGGLSNATSQLCNHYYYNSTPYGTGRYNNDTLSETVTLTTPTGGTSTNTQNLGTCDIQFAAGDTINGPLHTNDAINVGGSVTFNGTAGTSWAAGSTPAPASGKFYWGAGTPSSSGAQPAYETNVPLPKTNNAIQAQATLSPARGCLYTGPTRIILNSNGTMTVTSPNTKVTEPGCSTSTPMTNPQTVNLPANGVVYVQSIPGGSDPNAGSPVYTNAPYTSSSSSTGYPLPASQDNGWATLSYKASTGDAYVSGTLNGQLDIATANNIAIVGNLLYNDNSASSDDVLGLVAQNFVEVYHPVLCTTGSNYVSGPAYDSVKYGAGGTCTNANSPGSSSPLTNVTVNAAILSVAHSFRVQNYDLGAKLGTLTVNGAIIQEFRGPVGTSGSGSGTGYLKSYTYDNRLQFLPPPFFLNPTDAPWQIATFSEQQS